MKILQIIKKYLQLLNNSKVYKNYNLCEILPAEILCNNIGIYQSKYFSYKFYFYCPLHLIYNQKNKKSTIKILVSRVLL